MCSLNPGQVKAHCSLPYDQPWALVKLGALLAAQIHIHFLHLLAERATLTFSSGGLPDYAYTFQPRAAPEH